VSLGDQRTPDEAEQGSERRGVDASHRRARSELARNADAERRAMAWQGGLMEINFDATPVCVTSTFVVG
jgi:hypothetical protein